MKAVKAVGCALALFGFSAAEAEPSFYNATPNKYTIALTLPNGKVDDRDIDANSPGLGTATFVLAAGVKSVKVDVKDDTGASVWKGTSKPDDTFVLVPAKKGVTAVYAGVYGSDTGPQGVVLMNITGDALTLDLVGRNGLSSTRNIVPAATFDPKKMVRLDTKESTYELEGKIKGGEKVKVDGLITPGTYCLLWKDDKGNIKATTLGRIAKKK